MSEETVAATQSPTVDQAIEAQIFGGPVEMPAEEQAPESQAAPAPAPAPEPEAVQEEAEPTNKMVPLAALREERERRKEAAAELNALRERLAVHEERQRQMYEALQARERAQQQAQQPTPPSFEEDPAQYLKQVATAALERTQQLEQHLAAEAQQRQVEAQQRQQQVALRAELEDIAKQVAAYKEKVPDYTQAFEHVKKVEGAKLAALGMTPEQVEQAQAMAQLTIAARAREQGKNPAEVLYQMALASGYRAGVQTDTKLQNIAAGVQRGRSLGSGGRPGGELRLEDFASMSASQFAEHLGSDAAWRKLHGAA